jgi:hypothetical protein
MEGPSVRLPAARAASVPSRDFSWVLYPPHQRASLRHQVAERWDSDGKVLMR